jgi:hypothetical protein
MSRFCFRIEPDEARHQTKAVVMDLARVAEKLFSA